MIPTLTKSVQKIQGLDKRSLSGQGFSAGSNIYRFKGKASLGPSVGKKDGFFGSTAPGNQGNRVKLYYFLAYK